MEKNGKIRLTVIVSAIAVLAASRMFPHLWNFTPVGAIALFGGAMLNKRIAYLIPLLGLFLSDLYLNNVVYAAYYDGFTWFTTGSIFIYGSFAAMIFMGSKIKGKTSFLNVTGTALAGSMLFFVLTNFGSWLGSPMYPQTGAGLMASYAAGIPFFGSTVLSNLLYSYILFGGFAVLAQRYPALKTA